MYGWARLWRFTANGSREIQNNKWKIIKNLCTQMNNDDERKVSSISEWMNECVMCVNANINCCRTIKMRGKSHKDVNKRRVSRHLLLAATQLLSLPPAIQIQICARRSHMHMNLASQRAQNGRFFRRQNNSKKQKPNNNEKIHRKINKRNTKNKWKLIAKSEI